MKSKAGIVFVAIMASVFVVLSSSCTAILFSVSGTVLNVKADSSSKDSTLDGATITFTGQTDSAASVSYSATVSGDSYTVLNVEPGTYTISGSKSGFSFIPVEIKVSGLLQTAPNLLAFPTSSTPSLTIALAWESTEWDLDLHAKYGAEDLTATDSLRHVYYNNLDDDDLAGASLVLDRDVFFQNGTLNNTPVETMSLTIDSTSATVNDAIRFYVDQYSRKSSGQGNTSATGGLTGNSADGIPPAKATVYAFLSNGSTSSLYGVWKLPVETQETTLRVLKVDLATSGVATKSYDFTLTTDMINPGNHVFKGFDGYVGTPSEVK